MDLRLVLLIVAFAAVEGGDPKAPKCDPKVVDAIHTYWGAAGYPTRYFKEIGVTWSTLMTTNNIVFHGQKCTTYTPQGCGIVAVDVDGAKFNLTVSYKNKGMLQIKDDINLHHLVIADDEVLVCYRCNNDGPLEDHKDQQPIAQLIVSPHASSASIANAKGVLALLGFKLNKTFSCEHCLSTGTLDDPL